MPPPPSTSPVHTDPVWQLPPWQQAAPRAPQLSHVLLFWPGGLLQPSPALQVLFAQQGRPALPQMPHAVTPPPSGVAVVRHSRLAWHWFCVAPWQHAALDAPQAMHMPAVQRAPLAVQKVAPPPPIGGAPSP